MNITAITAALDAIAAEVERLPSLRTAEKQAWARASIATQERMESLCRARSQVASAIEHGLGVEQALMVLDKKGLLPITEIMHFTKAHREHRLDVPRFCRYLRLPSNVQSTPENHLNLRPTAPDGAPTPADVSPCNIPDPSPSTLQYRAPSLDFTTMKSPILSRH